jgi:protein-S-isoprenylcysteine O-methyltransferase Ste14
MLLVLIGWAVYLANVVAFLVVPLFVLYISRFQIIPEEHVLAEKFGAEFTLYKARVRRWL